MNHYDQIYRDSTVIPYYQFMDYAHPPRLRLRPPSPMETYGIPQYSHNYFTSSPAYYLARDIVGNKLGIKGKTYTEKDFTDAQLKVIDDQVHYKIRSTPRLLEMINNDYFNQHPNDTITFGIGANTLYPAMYGRPYGRNKDLLGKMFSPIGQVESTLGDYGVKLFKDGYEVYDTYDFNQGQGNYKGSHSLYALTRRFAGKHGHKDTDDDKDKLRFRIRGTLKQ